MRFLLILGCLSLLVLGPVGGLLAQEAGSQMIDADAIRETTDSVVEETQQKVGEITERVDQSEQAHEVSAGLLQPIYALAEAMAFPSFHWIAFTLMAAGVVSFAMQLVFGKLALLARMSFSLKEIVSDAIGLAISLIGLVLTTQAAAENSSFTESPAAVLSSAGVGVIMGLFLYRWGQRMEVEAAHGRKVQAKQGTSS